ncbi:hypothetical protein EV643_1394 [Kribbella sp. VKM Ac-2527]|uniref:Uncharacterized protein n=1 Tax=Kribbella caucasensis TaxID=2512215 RepID=A0A4R6J7B6_9ACTN|nr:hypothetical protein EV643_1394 [Kribbella sp. VKM Ac-2527]
MNPHLKPRRHRNWLTRYYGKQARFYLRVLRATRVLPPSIEASLSARISHHIERGL